MKKNIKILLSFLMCLLLLMTCVNAEEACKISLSANKTTLKPGDEVTITLLMSNVAKQSGIIDFLSILEYPDEVFELVYEENEELKAELEGTEFEGTGIVYYGETDTDTTIKNPWMLLCIEAEGEKGIYGTSLADPQIETQIVGKIKLKVKEGVKTQNVEVSLIDTEVLDAETEDETRFEILDSTLSLKIQGTTTPTTPVEENKNNTVQNQVKNIANQADKDVPYTGIQETFPIIAIILTIGILAYINYKKYKDI